MLVFTLPAFRIIPGYCFELGGTNYVITRASFNAFNQVIVTIVPVHAPHDEYQKLILNPDTKIDLNIPLM